MSSPEDVEDNSCSLETLPNEILCSILSFLDVNSLVRARTLSKSFKTMASGGSAGWENLCTKLWSEKVHVPQSFRLNPDPMEAYRLSVEDARDREFLHIEELLFNPFSMTGTVWSFRFKESAGTDWTSVDPWYNYQPCRKIVFLADGSMKEFHPASPGSRNSQEGPPFPTEHEGTLVDFPMSRKWRLITRPLDMPARPVGSYIRMSVGGRDVPTYCVRRSPTRNWGFVMESCWGIYASFELPKRPSHVFGRQPQYQLLRTQDIDGNWIDDDEADSSEESSSEREPALTPISSESSRLLIDEDTFAITSGLQWREAFLYNFGAHVLPEGDDAVAEFERTYALNL